MGLEHDRWLIDNCFNLNEIAVIGYYGRSGSVFLQSLLDNHPQVILFPGTIMLLYTDFWDDYSHLKLPELIAAFCEYFGPLFKIDAPAQDGHWTDALTYLNLHRLGAHKNQTVEVDKTRFVQVLKLIFKHEIPTRKSFFQAVHVAYTISQGRSASLDHSRLPLIIYHLHALNAPHRSKPTLRINTFLEDFPNLKVIQMIREPLQTLGSHFKHHYGATYLLNLSFHDAILPETVTKAKTIKLENLHSNPKKTLEKLANWLNITWNDCLLQSTFNGKQWWNTSDSEQVSGFNQVIVSKNHNRFYYKLDKLRLKVLYAKRYKLWAYSKKNPSKLKSFLISPLLLLPFKMDILAYKKLKKEKKFTLQFLTTDWLEKRKLLFKMWKYALSKEIKETELL